MTHTYQLASKDIEIINRLQHAEATEVERKQKADISAQHFAVMTRNAIKSVNLNEDNRRYAFICNSNNSSVFKCDYCTTE